ncbi:hypothetical protein OJF2_70930 [Aquisphaera giovannonii]|uniref:Uncharacterized protein n=1 Tax=Aquisphaera giovannonii TaxID=406548 RepID=A0A5B9WF36_9BACT|nr:hypothetical protein [Aquisphaera giovannonii]QEH38490.1 hypothetical protein OJF2_70930 [Aquisphaera giovannonii]
MYQVKAEAGVASATSTATASRGTTPACPEWTDRRATDQASRAARARQASGRRRFVDPTTCERDYNDAEMEFMMAMNEYKKASGRMFPTWSEVLEVLRSLGYEKVAPHIPAAEASRRTAASA